MEWRNNLNESEAATGGFLYKKVFLKISQNSKENTQVFSCELAKFPRTSFLRTPPAAASENNVKEWS